MKKLMIAAAIVCAAAMSQAAEVIWNTALRGVNPALVTDNGSYAAYMDSEDNVKTSQYVMTILSADGLTQIAQTTGSSEYTSIRATITGLAFNTTYQYEIVLDSWQPKLRNKTSPDYDYSASKMNATITGTFTTSSFTTWITDKPTSWDVSGIVATPEPTSGLLMLLGMAGLALKRKRA